jgi:hypothetical protein
MPGELSLVALLSSLKLTIHRPIFVFITIPHEQPCLIPMDRLQMSFREAEGVTLIVEQAVAESHGFSPSQYTFASKMITCDVHSSLEAVGFMAAISRSLADHGISCNPVSGYYHDHLFVPEDKAEQAKEILEALACGAQEQERIV